MRENTQCSNCNMVQFRTIRNDCRRCHAPLPERRPVPQVEAGLPTAEVRSQRPRCTVPQSVIPPLEETIRRAVLDALDKCEGNIVLAAKCLKIGKTTLYRRLRKWGWSTPHAQAASLIQKTDKRNESAINIRGPEDLEKSAFAPSYFSERESSI